MPALHHARPLLAACLAALALSLSAPPAEAELMLLGKRQFVCKKGEVRFHGSRGSKLYPPGKREKVRVPVNIGMLPYTCRYVRTFVNCPLGTEVVDVRRTAYGGRFEAECLGEPLLPVDAVPGDGGSDGSAPPGAAAKPDGAGDSAGP